MKVNLGWKGWTIFSAVIAAIALTWWLADNYLNPPVKAAIAIAGDALTIQNANRIDWEDPLFILEDHAELRVKGVWRPGEQRTLYFSQFRNPSNGRAHERRGTKGFAMTVYMPGFTMTRLYNWELVE